MGGIFEPPNYPFQVRCVGGFVLDEFSYHKQTSLVFKLVFAFSAAEGMVGT